MIGYILPLFVITLFMVFSISQVMEGKRELRGSGKIKLMPILQLVFGIMILTGAVIAAFVVLVNFMIYR